VHYTLPALRESKGTILVVSSMAGKVGTAGRTDYAPTKFAVNGFCEALRFELKASGVQVVCACPGYVVTEIHDRRLESTGEKRVLSKFITAETAATRMLTAVVNGDREYIMHKFAVMVQPLRVLLFPTWLHDKVIESGEKKAFSGDGGPNDKRE